MPVREWIARIAELYRMDRRGRPRIPAGFDAVLTGAFGAVKAAGLDLNREGAALRCEISLPVGARVFLRIPEARLHGFAEVRRCSAASGGWTLGLRFLQPLSRAGDPF